MALVQEAYLRALESFDREEVPRRPRAWLTRALWHVWIDQSRHERCARASCLGSEQALVEREWNDTARDWKACLELALARLPEREEAALRGFYLESQPMEEIAGAMGVSVRAVESLLRRARRRLGALLGGPQAGRRAS